jgi:hypothetical protein
LTERPEKNDFSKLFCVNDSIFRLFLFWARQIKFRNCWLLLYFFHDLSFTFFFFDTHSLLE